MDYRAYARHNFHELPQIAALGDEIRHEIEVVSQVLPFKVNNYVVEQLIDWQRAPDDPLYTLTFPRREMLRPEHYEIIDALMRRGAERNEIKAAAERIRLELNPHPAGQMSHNVPQLDGEPLPGMQHKYAQTVLFFPSQGQTCHAYCTFCFRWPQFVGMSELKFASKEVEKLLAYVQAHEEITDILFTGGDPLVMGAKHLASYLEPLLAQRPPHLRRIRIGTKAFSYWPYTFLSEPDSAELLALFRKVVDSGLHLAVMAHFNHPRELAPEAAQQALAAVRATGAVIRTQSPLLRHINDDPQVWAELWNRQVDLGCIPYYMFVARDTGAQHYFAVPLVRAWQIFRDAYQQVSGLARTVRGPSMSANPGKIQVLGVGELQGEQVITMRFLQGRNPDWVQRPFFAALDEQATWLNQLKPAGGEPHFFFFDELESFYRENLETSTREDFE